MMAGPAPIVRQLVLCERATYDFNEGYRLINPRVDFVIPPDESFPVAYPELRLFAQVTGSFDRQVFRVRLVDVTDPTADAVTVFESREQAIDLGRPGGRYRLQSRGWTTRLNNVLFPRPGRYEVWMTFDGIPGGKVEVFVEQRS